MSGYIEAGYVVVLATLGTYSASMVVRERAARRRLGPGAGEDQLENEEAGDL